MNRINMKNWYYLLLIVLLLFNLFACAKLTSQSQLIAGLEGFHLKETDAPSVEPIILDAEALHDFFYREDSPINWFPVGYRGLMVINKETGQRKEPEISRGISTSTELVNVYLADKENNILFIDLYELTAGDHEYTIYDFNHHKNIVSKMVDDLVRFIPFEPGKMLVMDNTGSWYFTDYELMEKATNPLTDELTRQIIDIHGKREVRHLSPDMWDELSQSDLYDLSFLNEPIDGNTLNLGKRIMFGARRELSWYNPTFVSIYWDEGMNEVKIEPVYKQRTGDFQNLSHFIFSPEGNWAKWEASILDKNCGEYVPDIYFHLVGDEYPQKLSMPVYGGTFATKSLEEQIDDGSFSDPVRASDYVRGEFLYHNHYGSCFVSYNLLNDGYLLVYPYDEIVKACLSGTEKNREQEIKQLEKLTYYNTACNGNLAYRFMLFNQEMEFYQIKYFETLESDFWSVSMEEPSSAAFLSPDGLYLLAIEEAGRLSLWRVFIDKKEIQIINRRDTELNPITTAAFSPVDQFFITGNKNGTVTYWDLEGNKLSEFNTSGGYINRFFLSGDGRYVVIGYKDSYPQLWEIEGSKIADLEIQDTKFRTLVDSEFGENALYIAQDEVGIHQFNFKGQLINTLYRDKYYNIEHFSISNDETKMVIWENYYKVFLVFDSFGIIEIFHNKPWIISRNNWKQTVELWSKNEHLEKEVKLDNIYGFNQITKSNDETFYAFGQEKKLIILDSDYDIIFVSEAHNAPVIYLTISPDSKYIASVDSDGSAFLWEKNNDEIKKYVLPVIESPKGIGFNNSSSHVVLWSYNEIIASDISGNILLSFKSGEDSEKIAGVDYNSLYYVVKGTDYPVIKKIDSPDFSYPINEIKNGYVEELMTEDYICGAFFSNDSEKLLLVSNFDKVYLFMLNEKKLIKTDIPVDMSKALYYSVYMAEAVNTSIYKNPIILSPSGKYIFSYSSKPYEENPDIFIGKNSVYNWNGESVLTIESVLNLGSAFFSNDEKYLITARGNRIKYWDISD